MHLSSWCPGMIPPRCRWTTEFRGQYGTSTTCCSLQTLSTNCLDYKWALLLVCVYEGPLVTHLRDHFTLSPRYALKCILMLTQTVCINHSQDGEVVRTIERDNLYQLIRSLWEQPFYASSRPPFSLLALLPNLRVDEWFAFVLLTIPSWCFVIAFHITLTNS